MEIALRSLLESCTSILYDRQEGRMNSSGILAPERNMLWAMSGNLCGFPGCPEILVHDGNRIDGRVTIGEIAHIYGRSKRGPRPAPEGFTNTRLHKYENLILLCPKHHKLIDGQPATYTVGVLLDMKSAHAKLVAENRRRSDFGSLELGSIITWLANSSTMRPSTDFVLLPPQEKIKYNELSLPVESYIRTGLEQEHKVRRYLEHQLVLDSTYPERLLIPLKSRYDNDKALGYSGDEIFYDLWLFAYGDKTELSLHTAALAVLGYYFVRCEIFEK